MITRTIVRGSTSQIIRVYAFDSASSIGDPLPNIVFNSTGLVAEYMRQGDSTGTTMSLITMTAGTWASNGFVESDVGGPWEGWYDVGIPDAALSATDNVDYVDFNIQGFADLVPIQLHIELVDSINVDTSGNLMTANHLLSTTVATLASQTSFTLTAGNVDDNTYKGRMIIITDQTTGVQQSVGMVNSYTGSSKSITLGVDPGIFTIGVGDKVDIFALDTNTRYMNTARVIGDGNTTPWDGA